MYEGTYAQNTSGAQVAVQGYETDGEKTRDESQSNTEQSNLSLKHYLCWAFSTSSASLILISQIIVGSMYISDCPAEPNIAIFLIGAGVGGLVLEMLIIVLRCTQVVPIKTWNPLKLLAIVFSVCSFVLGCYLIYHIYEPDYDPKSGKHYCNYILYNFAFWLLVVASTFAGICLVVVVFMLLLALHRYVMIAIVAVKSSYSTPVNGRSASMRIYAGFTQSSATDA